MAELGLTSALPTLMSMAKLSSSLNHSEMTGKEEQEQQKNTSYALKLSLLHSWHILTYPASGLYPVVPLWNSWNSLPNLENPSQPPRSSLFDFSSPKKLLKEAAH